MTLSRFRAAQGVQRRDLADCDARLRLQAKEGRAGAACNCLPLRCFKNTRSPVRLPVPAPPRPSAPPVMQDKFKDVFDANMAMPSTGDSMLHMMCRL